MSIIRCNLIGITNTYRTGRSSTHELVYRFHLDAYYPGQNLFVEGLSAAPNPLPQLYASYAGTNAQCDEVVIRQEHENNDKVWLATATFGKIEDNQEDNQQDPWQGDDPLQRSTIWSLDWETITEVIDKDTTGKPIVNSAGFRFDVPLTEDRRYVVIVAQKNFSDWEEVAELGETYDRCVNSVAFQNRAIKTVKFGGVVCSEPQWENAIKFYTATFRFVVKPDGWTALVVDRGFVYKDDNGDLRNVADDDEQLSQEPVLLDGTGKKLPAGQPGITLPFELFTAKDFNAIGL